MTALLTRTTALKTSKFVTETYLSSSLTDLAEKVPNRMTDITDMTRMPGLCFVSAVIFTSFLLQERF